jgi:hypothetical protein
MADTGFVARLESLEASPVGLTGRVSVSDDGLQAWSA